jgi:SAM-dependent methyltransferase
MTRPSALLLVVAIAGCSGTPTSAVEGNEVGVTPVAATPAPAEPEPAPAPAAKEAPADAPAPAEPVAVVPEERPALDIEYVPTPHNVVAKMLAVAKVKKTDVVYDLGCGDGRLVIAAAKKYGARGVGFDLDPERIAEAKANVEKAGVGDLVTIEQKNIFDVDLTPASVVTLYLLPEINVRLIPQLEKLSPGSRIISHDFDMKGVEYEQTWSIVADHHRPPPKKREHYVYKWTTPLKKTPLPAE